jgi:hypothetical protein
LKKKKPLTSLQRAEKAQQEVQTALEKYRCGLVAQPTFRWRDDGTWSVVVGVRIVANQEQEIHEAIKEAKELEDK